MNIWRLIFREIIYRKVSFLLGLVCVATAVGALVGSIVLLKIHDINTQQILESKQERSEQLMAKLKDDMRKATLKLGLNAVILPKEQQLSDWYTYEYGTKYMPEVYAEKLADSGIITIRHLLPVLQQKVKWPERKRTVVLVGTRGEVPNLHKSPVKPLIDPVPVNKMVLGYELHQSMGLKAGDVVKFMGREFTIHRCHAERGDKDDISVWINLKQAQEILDKKNLINAIIALECICAGNDLSMIRTEITQVLPNTKLYELGKDKILARFEARKKAGEAAKAAVGAEKKMRLDLRGQREKFASILVAVVIAASAVWIGFLSFSNARQRRAEIGILRALGFRSGQVLVLFLSKSILIGLFGGVLGLVSGVFAGRSIGLSLEHLGADTVTAGEFFEPSLLLLVLVLAPLLSAVAGWIPSMLAAQQDPAKILGRE
jgi:hypothetical protein